MFSLITTYGTYNPSLIILENKGYKLSVSYATDNDNVTLYYASCTNSMFAAHSAPELLGLVTLWEHFGENWNRQTPDLISELTEET